MTDLQQTIEAGTARRDRPLNAPQSIAKPSTQAIESSTAGSLRVAEKKGGEWVTHQWLKKAVLLSFRLRDNEIMQGGFTHYFDKVGLEVRALHAGGFRRRRLSRACRPPPRATAPSSRRTWC